MNLSLFIDRDTLIHRADGRTKVLGVCLIFALALMFSDPWVLTGLILGLLVFGALAHVLGNLRRLWVLLVLLFVYSLLLWPLFVEGQTPLMTLGNHVVTVEGVQHGLSMGLRLNVMLIGGLFLLSIMTIEEFSLAVQQMGVPRPLGFMFSLAFRWVPTLLGAVGTVIQAQQARGLDLQAQPFWQRIQSYPALVVPLIGHTLRQTHLLAMALESKGFNPKEPYRACPRSELNGLDYLAWGVFALIFLVCLWLWEKGYGTIS